MTSNFSLMDFLKGSSSRDMNLTVATSLLSNVASATTYDLYKQQEQEVVRTALVNSKKIQAKGEVELRNLQYQHSQQIGKAINTVAGAGGNLSGSNIDVIMQKKKFALMDEATVQINTSNAAHEVMREGYLSAANYAMQAKIRAQTDKIAAVGALLKGVQTYFKDENADRAEQARRKAITTVEDNRVDSVLNDIISQYGAGYAGDEDLNQAYKDQVKTQLKTNPDNPKIRSGLIGDFDDGSATDINSGGNNLWA